MATIAHSAVSLRISGDFVPAEMSTLLGGQPTRSHKKGDPHRFPNLPPYSSSHWSIQVARSEPGDFNAQIAQLFSLLTQDLRVWNQVSARYNIDVFCGIFMDEWNEGFSLGASTLKLLSDRNIKIGFDIYGQSQDGKEEAARDSS